MKFAVLAILAAGMALQTLQTVPQGVCHRGRVEREEIKEPMETMWQVYQELDCSRENIDAATTFPDGYTYFFKGEFYWRTYGHDVDPGFPRPISQDWDRLPGNLDAALTWKDNRTFFFKGHQYWSFHGMKMDPGYPRNISEGFCGIPDNVDAAMLWKNKNRAFFFKGNQYWRFDGGEACSPVLPEYPLSMAVWKGIPANVDAAMQWRDGKTYFFKGAFYYRHNDNGNDTIAGIPFKMHLLWGLKCSELNCRIRNGYQNLV